MSRFIHLSLEDVEVRLDHIVEIIDPHVNAPEGMNPEDYREPTQTRRVVMQSGHDYCVTANEIAQIREALVQGNPQ